MDALFLIKNGIPFDIAFKLDDITRQGWVIIFQQFHLGKKFNFTTQQFEDNSK